MVCLFISTFILVLTFVCSLIVGKHYKSKKWLTPIRCLSLGSFLSACFVYAPIFCKQFMFDQPFAQFFETVLLSIQYSLRLFVVDSDIDLILGISRGQPPWIRYWFVLLWGALSIIAPMLTFAFVLSFFKSFNARIRLLFSYNCHLLVFSELNEKSIALAKNWCNDLDNQENHTDSLRFVFCDVFEKNEEKSFELINQANEINAICFKTDILSVKFRHHSKKKKMEFFIIGEDESENIKQSLEIIKVYKQVDNTYLYFFSGTVCSNIILSSVTKGKIMVRRIDEVRSLTYYLLTKMIEDDSSTNIFENALQLPNGKKQIEAIVIGMGKHGRDMVKALTWFCQIENYTVKITGFDKEPLSKSKFEVLCPELMCEKLNGKNTKGEASYEIIIHSGINVETQEFYEKLDSIKNATFVFVSLGSDELNIRTAAMLRMAFERTKITPIIQAVVYDPGKKEALKNAKNFKGQAYRIDFVGDVESLYTPQVIINSEIEKRALKNHLDYTLAANGDMCTTIGEIEKREILEKGEADFYNYEYNYNSSVAKEVHDGVKDYFGLTPDDPEYQKTEHIRWNAYMRSEGYVLGEKVNHLGKIHPNLIPNQELSSKDKKKDV